jgi:secreted trypsin-like serine protease
MLTRFACIPAADHSSLLKEVQVPLWEQSQCERALKEKFGPTYALPETAICAGSEGHDACDVSPQF